MTNLEFRNWRKKLNLTRVEASKLLGISVSTIQLYEKGIRFDKPSPVAVPRVVEIACQSILKEKGKPIED